MRGMEPDDARSMATRLEVLAADIHTAHNDAYSTMISVSKWHNPAWRLSGVANGLTTWKDRLRAAADIVDRRAELVETLTLIGTAGGMESVRRVLRQELTEALEATIIDHVAELAGDEAERPAPVMIGGPTSPSNPNAGFETNSRILHGTEDTFDDDDGTLVQLFGDEVDFAVAVESETFRTAIGDFTFSAVGADGGAGYWIGVSTDGVEVGGEASLEAYLVQGEYSLDTDYLDLGAQVVVGAEAEAEAAIEFQPWEGDIRVEAGAEVGATASVGAEGQLGTDDLNVSGSAGVGVGAGAEANFEAGFDDWTFSFETGLGAHLGVGVEFDVGFAVDVAALGGGLVDFFNPGWAPWN